MTVDTEKKRIDVIEDDINYVSITYTTLDGNAVTPEMPSLCRNNRYENGVGTIDVYCPVEYVENRFQTVYRSSQYMRVLPAGLFRGNETLTSVTLPGSIECVGDQAFMECPNLQSLTFSDREDTIFLMMQAFEGCQNLRHITMPEDPRLVEIYGYDCPDDGVYETVYDAFDYCNLFDLTVTAGEVRIPDYFFLTPEYYRAEYDGSPFENREDVTSVVCAPYSMKSVQYDFFKGCVNLRSIILPEGLIYVHSGAFTGCSSLEELRFPDSVGSVDFDGFEGCDNLRLIRLPERIDIENLDFDGVSEDFVLERYTSDSVTRITIKELMEINPTWY